LVNEDDGTQDRAAIAVATLEVAMENFPYVPSVDAKVIIEDNLATNDPTAYILLEALPISFDKLEHLLKIYMQQPAIMELPKPITVQALPIIEDTLAEILKANSINEDDIGIGGRQLNGHGGDVLAKKEVVDPAMVMYAILELAKLGCAF
jgi:coatomer protein complex subunit gamma